MTPDPATRSTDATRRSVLKHSTLGASALALGAAGATGTALAQDEEDDEAEEDEAEAVESTVVLFGGDYRPGVAFDVLLSLGADGTETLFESAGLTGEFDTASEWDVSLVAFDTGGSAPELGHLMTSEASLGSGDSAVIGTDASLRNGELNLIETTIAAPDTDEDAANGADASGVSPDDYPAVDEWLTETAVGAAAPNYDETIVDQRDQETVTIGVGTGSRGWEFDPVAVAISPGTTVRWEWTGRGGAHNVEAEPDGQIGESDYEFSSGGPTAEGGTTYEQTFDDAGLALYHCEPHLSVGMKGAIVIES